MSVTAAGSSINVQQALTALRQSVQQEQVAASIVTQAATQAANSPQASDSKSHEDGRGERVDVKA
ncbi:MAG: hypothetical protein OEW37_04650 [Rhodospirillaceae bacterium]|nr:hypothetical protein [Rhodospirillaceae bacterium]